MAKKANRKKVLIALFITLPLLFPGCKKKDQPLPQQAPQPKPVATVPPPVQKQVSSLQGDRNQTAHLDFAKKKDPFKPFIEPAASAKPAPEIRKLRDVLPIQSYDVTNFKVSGIIVGLKENSALLIDPTGKGYVVKQGMQIGSNNGYISRITPSSLEVIEQFRDDRGRVQKRTVKLTMPQKSKEAPR